MSGVGALVTPTAWDKLMKNEEFKDAYKYFQNMPNPLREDVRKGFKHQGIYWEEYLAQGDVPQEDGTTVTQNFIPEGDIRFYPMGTRTTFRQYNAPADYIETVNTPGTDFYSAVIMPDRRPVRSVGVEGQMNTMPIAARPAVLVRGHSST